MTKDVSDYSILTIDDQILNVSLFCSYKYNWCWFRFI